MPRIQYTFLDAIEANERDTLAPFDHWRMLHAVTDGLLHAVSLPSCPTLTLRLVAEAAQLHDYSMSVLTRDFDHEPICIVGADDVVDARVFDPQAPAGHPCKRSG